MMTTKFSLAALCLGLALTGCAAEESASPGDSSVEVSASPTPSAAASAAAAPVVASVAPSPAASAPSKAAAAPAAKPASALADGSFTSTAPMIEDAFGMILGTARVTNTSDSEKTASFTYTLFKGETQVATVIGVADKVGAGATNTLQLFSNDKFVAGPYRFEFQVDAEY